MDDRRTRLLQLAAGAVFLATAVVLVLIVIQASSGDGGDTTLEDVALANEELSGIPQDGLVLGDPKAPVEVLEFADLQCPFCKQAAEEYLPPVIAGQVARGEAKIVFRNFPIIGEQSAPAGAAALAAGAQGRGWNFIEIFYRNQGPENSGYADDEFLTAVAKAAGVTDIAAWNKARKSLQSAKEVEESAAEAQRLGFTGTPSFAIRGPGTDGIEPLGLIASAGDLEAAIDDAR